MLEQKAIEILESKGFERYYSENQFTVDYTKIDSEDIDSDYNIQINLKEYKVSSSLIVSIKMNNEVIGSLTLKTYDEIENTISLLCELAIRHHRQIAAVESENEVDEFAESTRAHYLEKAKKHLSTY
jgi:transcriptional regulator with GAF, ATPase, and Fis domain